MPQRLPELIPKISLMSTYLLVTASFLGDVTLCALCLEDLSSLSGFASRCVLKTCHVIYDFFPLVRVEQLNLCLARSPWVAKGGGRSSLMG